MPSPESPAMRTTTDSSLSRCWRSGRSAVARFPSMTLPLVLGPGLSPDGAATLQSPRPRRLRPRKYGVPRRIANPMRRRLPVRAAGLPSARRNRLLAPVIVKAAARLPPEPAGLDVFHQQRTGAVFAVGQALVEHVHHREAGVEADEIGELQGPHGVMGSEPHADIDGLDGADTLVKGIDGLVDHRQQDAVDDEGGEILGIRRGLAELDGELPNGLEGLLRGGEAADQ